MSPKQPLLSQPFQRRAQLGYFHGRKKIGHAAANHSCHLAFGVDAIRSGRIVTTLGIWRTRQQIHQSDVHGRMQKLLRYQRLHIRHEVCNLGAKSPLFRISTVFNFRGRLPKFRKRLRPLVPCFQENEELEPQTIPLTRAPLMTRFDPMMRHQSFFQNRSADDGNCLKQRSAGEGSSNSSPKSQANLIINPFTEKRPIFEKQLIVFKRKLGPPKSICPLKSSDRRFSL